MSSIKAEWYSVRPFLKASVPWVRWASSSSDLVARGEHAQPNQALSQAVEMLAWPHGSLSAAYPEVVWKMCHPAGFLDGGSLTGRRETRVPQSIACRSTFTPSLRSRAAVVREAALMVAKSLGAITTIFSPVYPDSARSCLAFSRSGFFRRSAPASVSSQAAQPRYE